MEKAKEYNERSDYTPRTNSGDPEDHRCRPEAVKACWCPKEEKIKVSVLLCSLLLELILWSQGGRKHCF